ALAALRHSPWLLVVRTAVPPAETAVDAVCHCTDMHGLGVLPIMNEQPAIVTWSASVHTVPPATTPVCVGAIVAVPPCGHSTVAAVVVSCATILSSRAAIGR